MKKLIGLLTFALLFLSSASLFGNEKIQLLIQKLSNRNWESASKELIKTGRAAIDPLIEAMNSNESRWIQERAASTLSGFKSEKVMNALINAAENKQLNDRVRSAAVASLGAFEDDKVNKILINILKKKSSYPSNVVNSTVRSLGEIGKESSADIVIAYFEETSSYWAAITLGEIGSDKAVSSLIKGTRSDNWYVVKACQESLIKIGEASIIPLSSELESNEPYIKWQVAHILGKIGTEAAYPLLVRCLLDEDWKVRNEASAFFAKNRIADILPLIESYQSHENPEIQKDIQWLINELNRTEKSKKKK